MSEMFDIRRVSSEIYGENHLAITELKGSKFFYPHNAVIIYGGLSWVSESVCVSHTDFVSKW